MSWMKISPSWSLGDLADEAGAAAQRRHPGHGVGRRSAAGLARLAHLGVEPGRALGVEHLHRALDQPLLDQEIVVGDGDHVHNGIADRQHVQTGLNHPRLMAGMGRDGKPFLRGAQTGYADAMSTQPAPRHPPLPVRLRALLRRHGHHRRRARRQAGALWGLAVEAGIFAFLILVVVMSARSPSCTARRRPNRLVRFGFVPLIVAMLLIQFVLQLPTDPGMYEPAKEAFPIILGQGWRMMARGHRRLRRLADAQHLDFLQADRGDGRLLWLRGVHRRVVVADRRYFDLHHHLLLRRAADRRADARADAGEGRAVRRCWCRSSSSPASAIGRRLDARP